MNNYHIEITDFQTHNQAVCFIRETVFIAEQNVPVELEWDEYDEKATHLLVTDSAGNPVATSRMINTGHIGRMAVLKTYRKHGIGTAMLKTLVEIAQNQGLNKVKLSAQVDAIPFYEKSNFIATGDIYMDANIPHRDMYLLI